jgi:peptide/nickel transport system substrate-binding protein
MDQVTSKFSKLREEVLNGQLDRRSVLKRAMALGLSAPVIAGLLAACGGDDDKATSTTGSGTGGAATPTTGSAPAATATTGTAPASPTTGGGTTASPTTGGGTTASPTTGSTTPDMGANTTRYAPGQGRGKGDLLRILYWQAPTILNPHFSQGTKDSAAATPVLEPLIDIDIDGNIVPILAAGVPSLENGGVAPDGKSVTYKLREDVTWSDGTPFTADDVKFTWQFTTDKDASTTTFATYEPIEDVEVVDEHTLTIKFKEANPAWMSPFATGFGGEILPMHILKDFMGTKARDAPFNLKPIGTGPYVVADFKPGDAIQYEMNESYREADKPFFKQIEMKGGGDATAAATAALQTGETDWGWNLQVEKQILEQLASPADAKGTLLSTFGVNVEQILVNFADPNKEVDGARSEPTTQHPFLSDKNVRSAFMLAVDRDTVADQLYGPSGKGSGNFLVQPANFVSKNTAYKFDVEAAKKLLDDAGYAMDGDVRKKGDVALNVLYQTTVNSVRQKTQEIVKAGWESIGAKVELKSIDAGVYFSSDAGNPDTSAHFYADFEMFTTGPSVPYPIAFMAGWKSEDPAVDIAQKANQWSGPNYNRWVSDDYNKLYHQALTELDTTKQADLFIGMNDLVVNEIVEIPLVWRADVTANNKKLKGFYPSPWTPDVWDIANWYFEE